jgi:anti-sigma factor RsiW
MTHPFIPSDGADLTRSILALTSGSPCAHMRDLMCDLLDGALDSERRALAQAHLDHCPDCTALVASLNASTVALPRLAEVDPGPWFLQRVLSTTSRASVPVPEAHTWWWRLMRRPRIALEAAYLGAMAGFLGFNVPAAPLAKVWRTPAVAQPLTTSAQNLIQAEQRTVQAVAGLFVSPEGQPPRRVQRVLSKIRVWFNPTEPSAPSPRSSPQTQKP